MYASGPASPGPGPVSSSTGMETVETARTTQTAGTQLSTTQPSMTQASTVPESLVSPVTPGTVESGGDALYEMHGMLMIFLIQSPVGKRYLGVLSLTSTQIHHLLNFQPHSTPPILPTAGLPSPNPNVGPTPIRDGALSLRSHRRLLVRRVCSTPIQLATPDAHRHSHCRHHCRLKTC